MSKHHKPKARAQADGSISREAAAGVERPVFLTGERVALTLSGLGGWFYGSVVAGGSPEAPHVQIDTGSPMEGRVVRSEHYTLIRRAARTPDA